ncbi:MAG TPA: hypothetical protein VFA20_11430 [Myxococcaceae bacterium]|nr:hypothetical protein [Myxococcaceae bacterium]
MPELEAARKELGPDGPQVLAIALEDDPERLRNIAEAVDYRGAIAIYDGEDGMLDPLGVRSLPGTAFVDASGTVVSAVSGGRGRKFIAAHARALAR